MSLRFKITCALLATGLLSVFLMWAVAHSSLEIADLLLKAGARLDLKNRHGDTADRDLDARALQPPRHRLLS